MSAGQRVFIVLKPARQGYEARVHRGDPASSVSLRKIGLGRDARVIVKEGSYALGELIDLLAGDDTIRISSADSISGLAQTWEGQAE